MAVDSFRDVMSQFHATETRLNSVIERASTEEDDEEIERARRIQRTIADSKERMLREMARIEKDIERFRERWTPEIQRHDGTIRSLERRVDDDDGGGLFGIF